MKNCITLVLVGLVLFSGTSLVARPMEGRTGFGVSLHDYNRTPCLSFEHHMTRYQSFVGMLGLNTGDSTKTIILGGKYHQNIHQEENINGFLGLGAFYLSDKTGFPTASTGFEFDGLFGVEFFFSGLPNLGITVETGFAIRTIREVSFATMGNGFFGTGIHYYF
jgi:hypothetical protein